jgi:hypothetical protein
VDVPAKWEGADLDGVYQAGEFLIRANAPFDLQPEELARRGKPPVGRRVVVMEWTPDYPRKETPTTYNPDDLAPDGWEQLGV